MVTWILASRPKTLPAAVAPVAVGCALAWKWERVWEVSLAICTMLGAVFIQIATNFFNDGLDFKKGADTEHRLGPARATAQGKVTPRQMLVAGTVFLVLAMACGIPLLLERGWIMLAIGLPSLYFAYGYTGGPLPLAYRGLGDLWVLMFFGLVAVTGTYFVQTGQWPLAPLVAGFQVGMLSTVLIAINNLRDMPEDATTGKRTLAVRFGARFSRIEIALLCVVPHLLGIFWLRKGAAELSFWPLPTIALGILIALQVARTPPSRAYNKFLALAALQLVLFTALFVAACLR